MVNSRHADWTNVGEGKRLFRYIGGVFNDGLVRLHSALISTARQIILKHRLDDKVLLLQNTEWPSIARRIMSNPGSSKTRPSGPTRSSSLDGIILGDRWAGERG